MIAIWWAGLSIGMKILWGVTLTASLIFLIQSVATFIGADSGDFDTDIDFDGADADVPDSIDGGSGINLYSFRNLVNFCLGFGWTAILLQEHIPSVGLRLVLSVLVGIGLVVAVMYLFKWLSGMQQTGTINVHKSAVGCQGKVYLTIPGARSGEGKVQITIAGAVREYAAITDSDTLRTGTPIRVIEVINDSTLLVEELHSLII